MTRTLYFVIGGLCLCFAVIIAAELDLSVSEVAASPSDPLPAEKPTVNESLIAADMDKLTTEILERPLFAPGRRPPAAPQEAPVAEEQEEPEAETPPELTGRLAGVMIGPDDEREALFTRESDKPLSVKEGDDVDGWTVQSIEADRVVLKSEFGEKVVQPTFGEPGEVQAQMRAKTAKVKQPMPGPARGPAVAAAGTIRVNRPGGPAGAAANGANPPGATPSARALKTPASPADRQSQRP